MLVNRPPMGFNTWNTFGHDISDALVRSVADAMIENGLDKCGYKYVVIDDCWSMPQRDASTGKLVPNPEKFPYGMKNLADYIHSKSLKFGMYSDAGVLTCAGYPASYDHEFLDAQTFAEWDVDFLKYDFCYVPPFIEDKQLYRRLGIALRATGRDILFSSCWGDENVGSWIRSVGAHMYRSTPDIHDFPESYRKIAKSQIPKLGMSAPQCFNDTDMLTVGMYGKGLAAGVGMTDADYRSQFALWCMFSAPLMLGCDVRNMNEHTKNLITNPELLSINQDEEARPPMYGKHPYNEKLIILFKHLTDNRYALGFFNMDEVDAEISMTFAEFGLPANAGLDLRLHDVFGIDADRTYREYMRLNVKAHDCRVFIARPVEREGNI